MKNAYDTQARKRCFRKVVGCVFGVSGEACTAGEISWASLG